MGGRVLGLQLHRLLVLAGGLLVVALAAVEVAEGQVGGGVVGAKRDRLLALGDGRGDVSLPLVLQREVVVPGGLVRPGADRGRAGPGPARRQLPYTNATWVLLGRRGAAAIQRNTARASAPTAVYSPATMLQALLVTFREGIEAFLIVGVVERLPAQDGPRRARCAGFESGSARPWWPAWPAPGCGCRSPTSRSTKGSRALAGAWWSACSSFRW